MNLQLLTMDGIDSNETEGESSVADDEVYSKTRTVTMTKCTWAPDIENKRLF